MEDNDFIVWCVQLLNSEGQELVYLSPDFKEAVDWVINFKSNIKYSGISLNDFVIEKWINGKNTDRFITLNKNNEWCEVTDFFSPGSDRLKPIPMRIDHVEEYFSLFAAGKNKITGV